MKNKLGLFLAFALILSMVAACAPAATPTAEEPVIVDAQPATEEPAAVDAQPDAEEPAAEAPAEEVTLKVWDVMTGDVNEKVVSTLIAEFEAAHPGVKIAREVKTFDDMKTTAKLSLSAPDGPDIAQINQGYSDMGALVGADLLVDLTTYAEKYGWIETLSPGIVARNSFTPDGKTLGEGGFYAIPNTAELVGVFYNRELFEQAGVTVPTTFEEFEANLAKLKEAGITPINYGSLDAFVNIHLFAEIENGYIDRAYLDDFIYGRNNVSFDTEANRTAAAKMVEWVEKGYLTEDFNGIGYDDSTKNFAAGKGALFITGSWVSSTLIDTAPGKFGFFLVPGVDGAKRMSTGGTSTGFAIRKGSANPDLAAEYIDWMLSPRAAELWVEIGTVPVQATEATGSDPLFTDLLNSWKYMTSNDLVGHYLDWATPTFYDTLVTGFAELMAARITPEEFTKQVEADYAAYLSTK